MNAWSEVLVRSLVVTLSRSRSNICATPGSRRSAIRCPVFSFPMRAAVGRLFVLVIGAAALSILAAGCDGENASGAAKPAKPSAQTPSGSVFDEPVQVELKHVLVDTIESGVEALSSVAIDAQDRLYLAGPDGVTVLSRQGRPLMKWSTPVAPRCVAVDEEGTVYVGLRQKVVMYDGTGQRIGSWGKGGRGRGELSVVTSIGVWGTNVFVADAGNRCVHRFDATGDFINEIGKRDVEARFVGLICPSPYLDCAVDAEGVVHVTNPGMWRVERYRADGTLLGFWGESGFRPEQFSGCCNPTNIALMKDGSVVTAEKIVPRVKVYDGAGKMRAFIGPRFFSDRAAGLDLAVDSDGRIYVTDPGDGKIRVFALEKPGETTARTAQERP